MGRVVVEPSPPCGARRLAAFAPGRVAACFVGAHLAPPTRPPRATPTERRPPLAALRTHRESARPRARAARRAAGRAGDGVPLFSLALAPARVRGVRRRPHRSATGREHGARPPARQPARGGRADGQRSNRAARRRGLGRPRPPRRDRLLVDRLRRHPRAHARPRDPRRRAATPVAEKARHRPRLGHRDARGVRARRARDSPVGLNRAPAWPPGRHARKPVEHPQRDGRPFGQPRRDRRLVHRVSEGGRATPAPKNRARRRRAHARARRVVRLRDGRVGGVLPSFGEPLEAGGSPSGPGRGARDRSVVRHLVALRALCRVARRVLRLLRQPHGGRRPAHLALAHQPDHSRRRRVQRPARGPARLTTPPPPHFRPPSKLLKWRPERSMYDKQVSRFGQGNDNCRQRGFRRRLASFEGGKGGP